MSLISSQITQHEQKARNRHLSAVRQIGDVSVPGCFKDYIALSLLPSLVRIGFDREIVSNIFKVSAPAWIVSGLASDSKIKLHPTLTAHVREIRREIVSNAGSWITLPRAHAFLTKKDSLCLGVYLHQLDSETNPEFRTILIRVSIEFLGNYSLKFINPSLPENRAVDAIFYGYVTMFWKNLRQPPPGFEELCIFRNYLSWAKAFQNRLSHLDPEKELVITQMSEIEKNKLNLNISTSILGKNQEINRKHLTLRHFRSRTNHCC